MRTKLTTTTIMAHWLLTTQSARMLT